VVRGSCTERRKRWRRRCNFHSSIKTSSTWAQRDCGNLRNNKKTLVIQENDTPLAVLLNYEQYLIMQNQLISLLETIDVLTNEEETTAIKAGLEDIAQGRVKNIAEIRASLKKKK
jgi:PHD/YefM family antitoxin component YafN of YafNO toxin-antitoxin module